MVHTRIRRTGGRLRRLMLVLDNFEHVLAAAAHVAELVAAAPAVTVLVTSRAALRIGGEHEYPVPPLRLPEFDLLPSLAQLVQNEAVLLFVQRARAVYPRFELSETSIRPVATICHRMDGLPLAIELVARCSPDWPYSPTGAASMRWRRRAAATFRSTHWMTVQQAVDHALTHDVRD